MNLVKTEQLNNGVEIIIKKAIVNGNFAFIVTFLQELEDGSIATSSLTMEYRKKEVRDKDFFNLSKRDLTNLAKTQPLFKNKL